MTSVFRFLFFGNISDLWYYSKKHIQYILDSLQGFPKTLTDPSGREAD